MSRNPFSNPRFYNNVITTVPGFLKEENWTGCASVVAGK